MSCSLLCFKSLSLCGLRDFVLSMIAFQPPKDHKYEIQNQTTDPKRPPLYKLVLTDPRGNKYIPKDAQGIESSVFWLQTGSNKLIPAVFFENKKATSNYVLLYSHGNSTDLGRMRISLQELCLALNVHVFAYEYTGYGPARGTPSDLEVIFGITAAYEFLIEKLRIKWHQIILYGRSIGSGPSLYLASHPRYPVSGVILHSPIASGLRLCDINMKSTHKMDLFPNADFANHTSAHVFIIHGEDDKEVPVNHGKLLSTRCKNLYHPWWVLEGGHNDIDLKFRKTYFLKLSRFVKHIKEFNSTKTENELEKFYHIKDWHKSFNHIYFIQGPKVERKYHDYLQKKQRPQDYASFASNSSFLLSQNATNITFKTNTESIITTLGDQTVRRACQDSARSANEKENEESKTIPLQLPNFDSATRFKQSEIEFSYSYRSHMLKGDNKEAEDQTPKHEKTINDNSNENTSPNNHENHKDNHEDHKEDHANETSNNKEDILDLAQIDEQFPHDVSFDPSPDIINEVRKVAPHFLSEQSSKQNVSSTPL